MFSIVIQGKLEKSTYEFYIEHYKDVPLIFSTWENTKLEMEIEELPNNVVFLENEVPESIGNQNSYKQIVSTLNGLKLAKTPIAIKVRGDEFYSHLETIAELCKVNTEKLVTAPIFFKRWNAYPFHISDHLIAGSRDLMMKMFLPAKFNCENGVYFTPELLLCNSFLGSLYPNRKYGKEEVQKHFFIADLDKLKPYKIVANCYNSTWYDNFDPYSYDSIANILEL